MSQEANKTVFYIGGFELPDKNAAAQRVISNGKILKSLGYNVVFIGIDKSLKISGDIRSTKVQDDDFIYFKIKYPTTLVEWIKYLTEISFKKLIKEYKPSTIIAYNYQSVALFKLYLQCKTNKINLFGDCTEWYEPNGGKVFKFFKGLDTYFRMKILHPKLDGIIGISNYLYDYYNSRMKNVVLVPPLIDLSSKKWEKKVEFNNIENCIHLIYAGNPGTGFKDRLDYIIDSLSMIVQLYSIDIKFTIIGITKTQYLESYNLKSIPENLEESIMFMGRIEHKQVIKQIQISDYQIFIRLPNLVNSAGFPTKFVESMACGTPVLTNNMSNIDQYLSDGNNGFFLDISSNESLINTLHHPLMLTKDERKVLKKNCADIKKFDYREYVDTFRTLFKNSPYNEA